MATTAVSRAVRPGTDDMSNIDYDVVERALTGWTLLVKTSTGTEQREMLAEICRLFNVPREKWFLVPAIRVLWVPIAVQQLAETLEREQECSFHRALLKAAEQIGQNVYSHSRTLRRWLARTRTNSPDKSPPTRVNAISQTAP